MPCWVVLLVELLLDEGGNVLLNVELLQSLGSNVNCVLLHIFGHVCILDNCFPVCHLIFKFKLFYYRLPFPLPYIV